MRGPDGSGLAQTATRVRSRCWLAGERQSGRDYLAVSSQAIMPASSRPVFSSCSICREPADRARVRDGHRYALVGELGLGPPFVPAGGLPWRPGRPDMP
jgi:hypothetical protein